MTALGRKMRARGYEVVFSVFRMRGASSVPPVWTSSRSGKRGTPSEPRLQCMRVWQFSRERTSSASLAAALTVRTPVRWFRGKRHEAESGPPLEWLQYSMASYGAQFCEVRVHEHTGEVRVSRWPSVVDCGSVVNPKTAISQLRGGIIMGIGMALTGETLFDDRRGRIINPSLAEYHVPVNLDIPEIEVLFLNVPDPEAPDGARGIGEISITGAAACVANAVYQATGKRIRELPITLDKLL
jgi:CO/xanthine dehydrogenase Mo-binding subunit